MKKSYAKRLTNFICKEMKGREFMAQDAVAAINSRYRIPVSVGTVAYALKKDPRIERKDGHRGYYYTVLEEEQ